jgi:phosphoribosyl-ATP pyrophosphohydrolase
MTTKSEFDATTLDRLFDVIESRKGGDPDKSYVAKLYSKGREKIAQKLGEEAVETVIAATADKRSEIVSESADLLFHLMVLWADSGVRPAEVYAELAAREGLSGLDEKAARNQEKSVFDYSRNT